MRIRSKEIEAANIRRVGRVLGAHDGPAGTEDGRVLDVASVLWCTGFHSDFVGTSFRSLLRMVIPCTMRDSLPRPGLYFIGLPFQRDLSSSLLGGVAVTRPW